MTTDKAAAPVGCEYCGRSDCSADRHWQPIPPAAPVGAVPQPDPDEALLRMSFAGQKWMARAINAEAALASQAARMGELSAQWKSEIAVAYNDYSHGQRAAYEHCAAAIDTLRGEAG